MEGILAIVMSLGLAPTIIWLRSRHKLKERQLELEAAKASDEDTKRLADENKLLRERVENLESIVCSVDFELNQKVAKLLDEQRSLMLPAGGSSAALSASGADATGAGPGDAVASGTAGGAQGAAVGPQAGRAGGAQGDPAAAQGTAAAGAPRGAGAATPVALDRTATMHATPPGKPLTTALEPGQVLAQRYRVQRLLGKGGMGAVYLADDEVLGELVALKVISSAFAHDEAAMVARFRREAAAARKVSSPNVIRIHDLGEARPGLLYLSMEYFAGRTLADLIAQRGIVPLDDARDILRQVVTGLEAAHTAGVIHRDLKPSNVLIGERAAIKIIDFGLATTAVGDGLTATGAILGTPHYMAPEQIRGKSVDARTDIYALGALAYHLLCGRPPFSGDNAIAIGFAHLSEAPTPPRQLRKDIPANLEAAILAALAKTPDERPASARAFLDASIAAN